MKIDSIRDLKKLIDLCQKQGVDSIKVDGIELKLGEKPMPVRTQRTSQPKQIPFGEITAETAVIDNGLTPDQLLMWSVDVPDQEAQ